MYEFKELKATDVFLIVALIKRIGLNSFKDVVIRDNVLMQLVQNGENKEDKEVDYFEIGSALMDVVQVILERIADCEDIIYKMLSNCSNLSVEQVKDLNADVFIQMIVDYVKKEEFVGFFKQAMNLLGMMK